MAAPELQLFGPVYLQHWQLRRDVDEEGRKMTGGSGVE